MKYIGFLFIVFLLIFLLIFQFEESLISKSIKDFFSPVFGFFSGVSHKISSAYFSIKSYFSLSKENKELKETLLKLRTKNIELTEKIKKYERLKEILDALKDFRFKYIFAGVILFEPSNYIKGCVINKGYEDGVRKNMAVLDRFAVVGKILSVTAKTSNVIFLNDPNCRIASLIQRSRVHGVTQGTGGKTCKLKYLAIDDDIEIGDLILTSGPEASLFPKGIPIGRVTKLKRSKDGISLNCTVVPFAKFNRIEELVVVISE